MALQQLYEEIERLDKLKENRTNCTIDMQLKCYEKAVEAVGDYVLSAIRIPIEDQHLWLKIEKIFLTHQNIGSRIK